jgi:replicative DNA helicase
MSDLPPPPSAPLDDIAPEPRSNGSAGRGYDRVPPHSLEAEVSVLGAALLSRNAASEAVEVLKPDHFYRNAHRVVFEGIQDLLSQGEPIDTVTLTEWLARRDRLDEVGGPASLHDLTVAVPTAANAAYYARIVRERALLRRLIDAGTEVAKLGYEATEDADTVVDKAESLIYEVAQAGVTSDYAKLGDLLNESFEQIEKLAEQGSEVTGLSTGFDDLDRLTAGLQPQNLIIVAARPAMGKSSLSLGIAQFVTVKLRRPAIIFSLEMSKLEIVNRMLSSEARIDSSKLRTGRLEDTDWRKLGDALGALSEAPLFIDDTPSISLMEIRAKARRLKQKHGLDLIIVDYLQLMQSHKRVDSRQQEVAEISRGMKMLAKELEVPVIALSQLSRQPESRTDKRPQLADLRESGCLTAGTRLFRADTGVPVTFGELIEGDLRDVPVWSTDAEGELVAGRLTHAFPSGVKPVYRVRMRSGHEVEATANHPFRVLEGWKPLGELAVGARVAAARSLPEPSEPRHVDPDELVLLAHLIGEGTIVARQPLHYTSADPANLDVVEKAAWTRFGIRARRVPDARSAVTTQLYLPSPHRLAHGRRNPIAAWLDELGLWERRSWEKRLPAVVFGLADDQVRTFLHHLWATDGCLHLRGDGARGPKVSLYYATSSPGLARDVQLLLLRLGLRSRIRRIRSTVRDGYQVWIYGTEQQRRFLTAVGVHGARGDVVESALAALGGTRANPNVDVLPLEILATDGLTWDEIVEIEPIGEQPVYDATVLEHHNFVAEGLVLHNSIEQDADIVGFIYRDEVYDEESPDKGIAELIIAKHRNGATGVVKLAFLNHLTKFANLARGSSGGGGGMGGAGGNPTPV